MAAGRCEGHAQPAGVDQGGDLKLRLNASDCDAVMFDAVIIEVRKAGSVLKRKLDTQEQDAVVDPSWLAVVWLGSCAKVACPH